MAPLLFGLGWLLCGLLAFGVTKYKDTEKFHFHGTLEYEVAFDESAHLILWLAGLVGGPVTLLIFALFALLDQDVRAKAPDHRFGIAFTKNIRWPNHHHSSP